MITREDIHTILKKYGDSAVQYKASHKDYSLLLLDLPQGDIISIISIEEGYTRPSSVSLYALTGYKVIYDNGNTYALYIPKRDINSLEDIKSQINSFVTKSINSSL